MALSWTDPRHPSAALAVGPELLGYVPTQHVERRSALVEADDVTLEQLFERGPVRLATILAAALPELGLVA